MHEIFKEFLMNLVILFPLVLPDVLLKIFTRKGLIERLGDLFQYKNGKRIYKNIKSIIKEYKKLKYLTQNPSKNNTILNLEYFRIILLSPFLLGITFFWAKDLMVMFQMPNFHNGISYHNPIALMVTAIVSHYLFKLTLEKHVAPTFYFIDFHKLTCHKICKNLEKLKNLGELEKLKNNPSLNFIKDIEEVTSGDLTNIKTSEFSLSFYDSFFNYPLYVEKKIKKDFENFKDLKKKLKDLLKK